MVIFCVIIGVEHMKIKCFPFGKRYHFLKRIRRHENDF